MTSAHLINRAEAHLKRLCLDIPNRRVGSPGNRAATDYFADVVSTFGFDADASTFACMDWRSDGVDLSAGDTRFQAFASPYSLGCRVRAPLAVIASVEALETADVSSRVVLLRGAIAREQLMPKNFPFYNPDEHRRIIQALESARPAAIIAATSRDEVMVGSLYPFPLIEDGDFDIPSVYMTDEEGNRLATFAGREIMLESRAERIPSEGSNITARKGASRDRRVVLFAHIDAKMGTPGAIDNASGVVVLLLLAELLADYTGSLGVEIVALNGEDYYSNPGEQQYLAVNAGRFDTIVLGINIDGAGYRKGRVAYSLYDCPEALAGLIRSTFAAYPELTPGEAWFQGDHGLFLLNQRPALALTSEHAAELMAEIIHTPKDDVSIVEPALLVSAATALHDLIHRLDRETA